MNYYRANLTVGTDRPRERIVYIKGESMIAVLDVTHKIKNAKLNSARTISWPEYVKGVQQRNY